MKSPEQTKQIAHDWRRQKRQKDYLRLPHAKLVELLCDARYTIMCRNQQINTLQRQLREKEPQP